MENKTKEMIQIEEDAAMAGVAIGCVIGVALAVILVANAENNRNHSRKW